MTKQYLIIYENSFGEIFRTFLDDFESKKDALSYFKKYSSKYGYKVIAIREITSDNIYL